MKRDARNEGAYVATAVVYQWICLSCRRNFATGQNDNVHCPQCTQPDFVAPFGMTVNFVWKQPTGGEE